jgi:hypothetical protein
MEARELLEGMLAVRNRLTRVSEDIKPDFHMRVDVRHSRSPIGGSDCAIRLRESREGRRLGRRRRNS